jgi:transposase
VTLGHRSSGRHSRSRWRRSRYGDTVRRVSLLEDADSGYQGPKFALAKVLLHLDVEIVKRSDRVNGFAVSPERWIVEHTIAWLNRCRRLAKDWENLNRKALAFLRLASIRLMLRKLCNPA